MDKEILRMQRLAGVITESQYNNKLKELVNVGGVALGQTGKKSADVKDEEASSAADEFLLDVRLSPILKTWASRNMKFDKIEVSKKEGGEEKGGFFKKLGSKISSALSKNLIYLYFKREGMSKGVAIGLKEKNGKFTQEDISEITKTLSVSVPDESKQKLINFIKSRPEVKEAFPEIDKMLDTSSFN